MYNYQELTKGISEGYSKPSEAMNFNGNYLEDEIEGYRTMSVSGRELLAYDVSSQPISGTDGATFLNASLPSRTLTVKYQLTADTPEDLREKYNHMNQLLSKKQAVISFDDEPEYEFIGTLGGASSIPEGRLNVVASFDILCTDPFKYKMAESQSGTGSLVIQQELREQVVVDEIIVTPLHPTDTIEIINESKDLTLRLINASQNTNQIMIYPRSQRITRSNLDRPELLDWVSDFENFEVSTGDTITVSPSDVSITIKLRERLR